MENEPPPMGRMQMKKNDDESLKETNENRGSGRCARAAVLLI